MHVFLKVRWRALSHLETRAETSCRLLKCFHMGSSRPHDKELLSNSNPEARLESTEVLHEHFVVLNTINDDLAGQEPTLFEA